MVGYILIACAAVSAADRPPHGEHGLHFDTAVTVWDEALPLGNGILGALVWGDGHPLRVSLDRTDLWDLRPVPEFHSEEYSYTTMREWEAAGRYEDLKRVYEDPYHRPGPSKIPAGRIELTLDEAHAFTGTDLDLARATAGVSFSNDARAKVWIHATEPLGVIVIEGARGVEPFLRAPAFGRTEFTETTSTIIAGDLSELEYPSPEESRGDRWQGYQQEGWDGFRFAGYLAWRVEDDRWLGMWSVASSFEGNDPLAIARARVEAALDGATDTLRVSHEAWWTAYWNKSWVTVPHPGIERQWYLDVYKFGAASRSGHPPITLQGPWTADNDKLPPWKGDYHHDLNTQLSYWPCYSGNRLEEGENFVSWLWDTRENCREWTRRFFEMPGLNVPMTADLNNRQIGGWRQYTHSSTTAAWLAHHFYLHWTFSADEQFLKERAYPYLRDCAVFLEAVTAERDAEGKRTLPLTSSPEIHDNRPNAWFPSITNYDLALIRWVMTTAAAMADRVGAPEEAAHWRAVLGEMPELNLGDDGRLLVAADHPLEESHRHFSHLMAIHPLGLIDWSHGPEAQRTIRASLAELDRLSSDYWTGYSFSWLASLAARAKDGEAAARALEIFAKAFVLRNSFHANGDQSGQGYSTFAYRPFTLEGNFAFAAGLQEMLLQSHTGEIEVFPAIPASWQDVRFHQLRAQGGFLVSAALEAGELVGWEVTAERDGPCRIRSPKDGTVITLRMAAGETVDLLAHTQHHPGQE
jgi:alpha-L-fucosidase 2